MGDDVKSVFPHRLKNSIGNLLRLDPLPDRPGHPQGIIRSHPVDRFRVEVLLPGDARFDPAGAKDGNRYLRLAQRQVVVEAFGKRDDTEFAGAVGGHAGEDTSPAMDAVFTTCPCSPPVNMRGINERIPLVTP